MVTKGNVLVVDDEVNLCRILGAKLAKSGYSVVAVHDGLQALEKIRENSFDVVLLDLLLPKMDGLTALAEIRGMDSSLPIIVMTACENAEALALANSHGVSAYLNKPFDLDNLVALVSDTSMPHESKMRPVPDGTVLFCKDQPITLDIQNGKGPKTYCGCIHNKDDRTLSVAVPRMDSEVGNITPYSQVKVSLPCIDALYTFNTRVMRLIETPERILVLDKPAVIYRLQRREHPRLALRVPAAYGTAAVADSDMLKVCETLDISLGGLKLAVNEEMPLGEIVRIELHPKTVQNVIHGNAEVVRSGKGTEMESDGYVLACKFTSVDESLHTLLEY